MGNRGTGGRRRRGTFVGVTARADQLAELHIEEDVVIAPDLSSVRVQYRSAVNPADVRVVTYTDAATVSRLAHQEQVKAELAAADARRTRPVQSFFKPFAASDAASDRRPCDHCDGRAVFDGEACPVCGGMGVV